MDPVAALLAWRRGAASTVLPVDARGDVLAAAVRGRGGDRPRGRVRRGRGGRVARRARVLPCPELAEAEELVADGLLALAQQNRLAVVVGVDRRRPARKVSRRRSAADSTLELVDPALWSGIEQVAEIVEDLPEHAVLAFGIDPALPLAAAPGAVALDLAACGICPVLQVDGRTRWHRPGPRCGRGVDRVLPRCQRRPRRGRGRGRRAARRRSAGSPSW